MLVYFVYQLPIDLLSEFAPMPPVLPIHVEIVRKDFLELLGDRDAFADCVGANLAPDLSIDFDRVPRLPVAVVDIVCGHR